MKRPPRHRRGGAKQFLKLYFAYFSYIPKKINPVAKATGFIFTKRFSNFFCGAIADIFFLVGFGHVPPLKIKVKPKF